MKRLEIGAVLLAIALGASASAAAQATAQAKKQTPATADQAFAREAAVGGMAEVELGKLASENAEHADVKQFGERMVADHSKANDELKAIADKQNMTLPTELDAKYKALRDKLAKLKGADFDRACMREMVRDHQQDVAKFRKEAKGGKNADLREWAGKTVTVLEEHLAMAKEINAKVGGAMKKPK